MLVLDYFCNIFENHERFIIMKPFETLKISVGIFTLILFATSVSAQYTGGSSAISVNSSSFGVLNFDNSNAWNKVFITDRPVNSTYQTGSPFVNTEWQMADITLLENQAKILNVPVRIDAKANLIEINHEDRVKVLHATNTYSLAFKSNEEVYISNSTLGIAEPVGFFKIIYNKKSSLLCHYSTKLVQGAYNPILDAGIKEDKLVVEQTYYIFQKGKLLKLEKNRKKLLHQFEGQPEISQFIKAQKITPKFEYDLLKLIGFIDSLS